MSRLRDQIATRLRVWRARPPQGARGLTWMPEPRTDGSLRAGQRILGGTWHLAGELVENTDDPWIIDPPSLPFALQLHGMGWLDDILAVGTREAAGGARDLVMGWVDRFGQGSGPGWMPATLGRRLLRMISHAPSLMSGLTRQAEFFDSLYRQAHLLEQDWRKAPAGLPRIEALTGLLYAGLTLDGLGTAREGAVAGLTETLAQDIRPDGGIENRNPEALLSVATLLGWAIEALREGGHAVPEPLTLAQTRIIPTLRALRHGDGALARFHGGGPGRKGRLDRVLTESGIRARNDSGLAMGFIPMGHGRTSVIVDADAPASGVASGSAHASTLAFELTSGRHPVIVSCGPGGEFGADWHRAARATASHSTLSVDGASSSRIGAPIAVAGRRIAPLVQQPEKVQWQRSNSRRASTLLLMHTGYVPSHGLSHLRRLVLSTDGRILQGEDSLRAINADDKERFEDVQTDVALQGIPFKVRFHLHPETEVELGLRESAATLTLPDGETWILRPGPGNQGYTGLSLEPSAYLDPGHLNPRPSQQVVFTGRVLSYAATIDWTLTRIEDAPAS